MKRIDTLLVIGVAACLLTGAGANDRRYTYIYETSTMPKGAWEYEQWFTWKGYDDKNRFDFRHEVEWGVTDRLQLALYLADWRYESHDSGTHGTDYVKSAVEAVYNLTDPHNSPFGSALYGEVAIGDQEIAIETKLLLEKNYGPLNLAYNFKMEAVWEGPNLDNLDEDLGEFGNYLGASYQFSPKLTSGLELVHEWEVEGWDSRSDDELFFGPNVSWRKGSFFVTATALWEVLDTDGAANNQVRVLAGIDF